jgi:hypothetical protein
MATKKTTEETTTTSGLVEETTPEVSPVGIIATQVLNEPAPERVDTGHPSRDFTTPIN